MCVWLRVWLQPPPSSSDCGTNHCPQEHLRTSQPYERGGATGQLPLHSPPPHLLSQIGGGRDHGPEHPGHAPCGCEHWRYEAAIWDDTEGDWWAELTAWGRHLQLHHWHRLQRHSAASKVRHLVRGRERERAHNFFWLCCFSVGQGKKFAVQIEPVVGELLRPVFISEQGFLALQGDNCLLLINPNLTSTLCVVFLLQRN